MIDLKDAYEVRDILDNKVIDSIIDEFGNLWYEAFKILPASGVPPFTLQKCKGVDLVDYKIYGNTEGVGENTKNLFNVKEWFPDYVNDENGITYTNKDVVNIYNIQILRGEFKETTQYTLSLDYDIYINGSNSVSLYFYHTDGSYVRGYLSTNGTLKLTSSSGKTVDYVSIRYSTSSVEMSVKLTNIQIEEGTTVTDFEPYGYRIPIKVRGKNYFDLNKVPFSNNTTRPYNNGLIATKVAAANRGDRIPIDLPIGKTIYVSLDVVDSQIAGTAERVSLDFLDSSRTRVFAWNVTSSIAHKSYSYTPTKEIAYVQFYFQSNDTQNAVGDTVTVDNIMIRCEGDDTYESYVEPRTTNVYAENSLKENEYISFSEDGLPNIPTFKGTTIIEIDTEILPSSMEVEYYGKDNKS